VLGADGTFSSTDLGPETSNPDRQFHLVRAGGRLVVLKIEERFDDIGTIEVTRVAP
jgi:hypothetical protein